MVLCVYDAPCTCVCYTGSVVCVFLSHHIWCCVSDAPCTCVCYTGSVVDMAVRQYLNLNNAELLTR